MPIGGFIVMVDPKELEGLNLKLTTLPGVEVYGSDTKGNIVVVMETETSDQMEKLVNKVSEIEGVLSVALTYLHAEDEVEEIEKGHFFPEIPQRKHSVY